MGYTILSFCGGGIRGLLSATLMQQLFGETVPATDLLAGTSTGSDIVSWLLAGQSTQTIIDNYTVSAVTYYSLQNLEPTQPAYSVDEVLLSQFDLHGKTQLSGAQRGGSDQSVLFTSFNVGANNVAWSPTLFTNMVPGNEGTTIAEAVVGSSAMPGMMGSLGGQIDGAFVNHDPTLAAIALAVESGQSLDDIYCICFGTGLMHQWIASETSSWGAQQWMNGDGNPDNNTPPLLINWNTPAPILNVTLNGTSTSLVPTLAGYLLGDRYAYLDATLDRYIPENDVVPADLQYLQQVAGTVDLGLAQSVLSAGW